MKKALFLFFAFAIMQVSAQTTYFIGGNIYYYNSKTVYSTNLTPNRSNLDSMNYRVNSIDNSNTFKFRPSILKKTKKGNFNEFEFTNLTLFNTERNANYNFGSNQNLLLDSTSNKESNYRLFKLNITHVFYWNLLKKVSKKVAFNFMISNTLGYLRSSSISPLQYIQKSREVSHTIQMGFSGSYLVSNRFLIGYRASPFFRFSTYFRKLYLNNPNLPSYFSGWSDTKDFFVNIVFIPTLIPQNFTISLAYKL